MRGRREKVFPTCLVEAHKKLAIVIMIVSVEGLSCAVLDPFFAFLLFHKLVWVNSKYIIICGDFEKRWKCIFGVRLMWCNPFYENVSYIFALHCV